MKICTLLLLSFLATLVAQMAPQPLPQVKPLQGDNYSFSWESVPGRVYFIQTSSTLNANEFDWEFVPDIRVGTGNSIEMGFQANTTGPEFFRLIYSDYSGTMDPNLADFDNDGYTNLEEAQANTNSYDAQSYPGNDGDSSDGNTSGSNGGSALNWMPPWEYELTYSVNGSKSVHKINPHSSRIPYSYLLGEGVVTQLSFKDNSNINRPNNNDDFQINFLQVEPNLEYGGEGSGEEQWKIIDVVTLSTQNPNWSYEAPYGSLPEGLLLPIEIIQPKIDWLGRPFRDDSMDQLMEAVNSVRFNKWRYAVVSEFNPLFRLVEADRFRVRIPMPEGLNVSCRMRTKEVSRIQDLTLEDQPWVPIVLKDRSYHPAFLTSKPTFLVSDITDDVNYNGKNTEGDTYDGDDLNDNELNDATFLASEEGVIEIEFDVESDEVGASKKSIATFPVKNPIGYVELNLIYHTHLDISRADEIPENHMEKIMLQFEQARDVYRQIGIEIVQKGDVKVYPLNSIIKDILTLPSGRINYEGIPYGEYNAYLSEMWDLFAREGHVNCVFTDLPITHFLLRHTIAEWRSNSTSKIGYLRSDVGAPEYVLAHEVGHALGLKHTNRIKSSEDAYEDPYMLMSPISQPFLDSHKDAKRFHWFAEITCQDSVYFKKIK